MPQLVPPPDQPHIVHVQPAAPSSTVPPYGTKEYFEWKQANEAWKTQAAIAAIGRAQATRPSPTTYMPGPSPAYNVPRSPMRFDLPTTDHRNATPRRSTPTTEEWTALGAIIGLGFIAWIVAGVFATVITGFLLYVGFRIGAFFFGPIPVKSIELPPIREYEQLPPIRLPGE